MLIGGVVDEFNDWCAAPAQTRDVRSAFREETTANGLIVEAAPDLFEEIRRIAEGGYSQNREQAIELTDRARLLFQRVQRRGA